MPDEQRFVLGLAYQAGPDPRIRVGADGTRDYFVPEELEKAAWSFLDEGGSQIGVQHADGTVGAARVAESYIYRGPDWQVGDTLIKSGDWLIGVILDETSWALAKSGQFTGFSPQGVAKRRHPTRSTS